MRRTVLKQGNTYGNNFYCSVAFSNIASKTGFKSPGDELMTREAFADNKINNRLHVARDGEEALDFLYRRGAHTEAPRMDLILLDLNLPKYDGRQVLEQIKSDPDLTHVPVVVLTAKELSAEELILDERAKHLTRAAAKIEARTAAGIFAKAMVVRASRSGAAGLGVSLAEDLINCPGLRASLWPAENQS